MPEPMTPRPRRATVSITTSSLFVSYTKRSLYREIMMAHGLGNTVLHSPRGAIMARATTRSESAPHGIMAFQTCGAGGVDRDGALRLRAQAAKPAAACPGAHRVADCRADRHYGAAGNASSERDSAAHPHSCTERRA